MAELSGRKRFAHLFRRAGFGATEAELTAAMQSNPDEETAFQQTISNLLNPQNVAEAPDLEPNPGANETTLDLWWVDRLIRTKRPLLEKMTYFWQDHFATSLAKGGIDHTMMKNQNEFLRTNALGNFKTLLDGISRDPAMVVWMDLFVNRKLSPNENYARELMELFSLGVGLPGQQPYTEADIREATRAFTGYTLQQNAFYFFNTAQHDFGTKVVLGKTCESGDEVNSILLAHVYNGKNVCSRFITAKLFSFLVWPVTIADAVIDSFADYFVSQNFSVYKLVEAMLRSAEFSSNQAYRSIYKTPAELLAGAYRALGADHIPRDNDAWVRLIDLGERPFMPPDVNGWPKGRAWINAGTLINRCNMFTRIIRSMGAPGNTGAGGPTVQQLAAGLNPQQFTDMVLTRLLDNEVPAGVRSILLDYASHPPVAQEYGFWVEGMFNLVMDLPQYHMR
ncbi:MAG: DUF1800 domain-containing protein [Chloroflexota bacterium]